MSYEKCKYSVDGFLICNLKEKTNIMKSSLTENFKDLNVCQSGSWKSRCTLECNNNIMNGICMDNSDSRKTIKPFDTSKCAGRDIYFDMNKNNLTCDEQ
jgi:hypothetical protein